MFLNYLRAALIAFILFFASPAFSAGTWHTYNASCFSGSFLSDLMAQCSAQYQYCGQESCELYGQSGGIVKFAESNPCDPPTQWNPGTTTCTEAPPDCGLAGTYDPATGVCNLGAGATCDNILGYIDGHAMCGDAADECAAAGGALGSMNGETVCVPETSGPPTCDGGGVVVIIAEGYVCESPTDNQNGTDNEEGGSTAEGQDPNTEVNPENPDSSATPPTATTSTDPVALAQSQLAEEQAQTKEQKKQTNQLGDVNKELDNLTGKTDRVGDLLEVQGTAKTMPGHTVADAATVGEAFANFSAGVDQVPIVQAFSAVSDVFPSGGGQCPQLDIDLSSTLIGQNVSTDLHCDLFDSISTVVYGLMLVVFGIAAFRVVGSA